MKLRHGDDPDYWLAVAKCFLLNNGPRSAKKACERALYCRKNFPEARFVVADANEGTDEEAAEREYAALLEIKELSPFLVSKISLTLANITFRQSTRAMNENAFGTKEEK